MRSNFLKYSFLFIAAPVMAVVFAFTNKNEPEVATAERGIQFIEQDWDSALQQAKAENKLVFLDIYATWCGPCKLLKKNTFTDEKVGYFFNKNFVNVSVDGEKTVGPELARKYSIRGYPSLIVTDADGNPVLYTAGYVQPEYLLAFAEEALRRKSQSK